MIELILSLGWLLTATLLIGIRLGRRAKKNYVRQQRADAIASYKKVLRSDKNREVAAILEGLRDQYYDLYRASLKHGDPLEDCIDEFALKEIVKPIDSLIAEHKEGK